MGKQISLDYQGGFTFLSVLHVVWTKHVQWGNILTIIDVLFYFAFQSTRPLSWFAWGDSMPGGDWFVTEGILRESTQKIKMRK